MKVHFSDRIDPVSIIEFFATFELACDTNNFHEGAGMWVLPFFEKKALATALSTHMSVADHNNPVVVSVNTADLLIHRKLLQSYPEVMTYFLKKFANDQEKAEIDSKLLCYIQLPHMTLYSTPMIIMQNLVTSQTSMTNPLLIKFHRGRQFLHLSQLSKILGYARTSRGDRHRP